MAGDYARILTDEWTRSLVKVTQESTPESIASTTLATIALLTRDEHVEKRLLCIGIAYLESFIQSQWTGPPSKLPSSDCWTISSELNKQLVQDLGRDGELCYPLVGDAIYLKCALVFLVQVEYTHVPTAIWWACRALFVLQRVLDHPVASIYEQCAAHYTTLLALDMPVVTRTHLLLEIGLFYQWYHQDALAMDYFKQAQQSTGLEWELSGALGKRTKFQQFDVSQLVLLASSSSLSTEMHDTPPPQVAAAAAVVPTNLPLQDDTLLETVSYTQQQPQQQKLFADTNLSPMDQCILLAYCLDVRNTNPVDGLTVEQMLAFVERVLQHPNNWSIHSMALLLRSRLETRKSRTIERAVLQLQALVDQIHLEEKDATNAIRIQYFYALALPPRWELEKELAERFLGLGALRSALDIFLRLELWDEVIFTYRQLQEDAKAEKLILERLAKTPDSPQLLCLLGDIRQDVSLWQQAWESSKHHYGRAMRALGNYYFSRRDYPNCIASFQLALALNPLFENVWFILGCAAMQTQQWPIANEAFSRVVAINFENAEAWNNLGSVHLKQSQKEAAFRAFFNALREKRQDYRIWRNYLWTALDVHRYAEAMEAITTLVELEGANFLEEGDDECFHVLVVATTQNMTDAEGMAVSRLASKLLQVFHQVTSVVTHRASIWSAYTDLLLGCGMYDDAFQTALKGYRAVSTKYSSMAEEDGFVCVVDAALDVAKVYGVIKKLAKQEEDVPLKSMFGQCKSLLRGLMGRTRRVFEDHASFSKLENALEELEEE